MAVEGDAKRLSSCATVDTLGTNGQLLYINLKCLQTKHWDAMSLLMHVFFDNCLSTRKHDGKLISLQSSVVHCCLLHYLNEYC